MSVKFVVTGDVSHVEKGFHKLQREVVKLKEKLKESGKSGKTGAETAGKGFDKLGDSITKAFDPKRLAGMLTGLAGVHKIIGTIKTGLAELERRRAEAAAAIIQTEMPAAKLAQLAKTPAEFREILDTAKEFYRLGGAKTREEAYATIFQLKSADALKEMPFFAQLKGVVPEIPETAGVAAKIQAAFGKKEAGSLEEIVGKGIEAARTVTDVGVTQILQAVIKTAKLAQQQGITDEQAMAAISIVAKEAESADIAGTQVRAMLDVFGIKRGFKGLDLEEMVKKVSEMEMESPELKKWFGRKEARMGFLALAGKDITGRAAEIGEAAGEARRRIDIAMGAEEVSVPREHRQAYARAELRAEQAGYERLRSDVLLEHTYEKEGEGLRAAIALGLRQSFRALFGDKALTYLTDASKAGIAERESMRKFLETGEGPYGPSWREGGVQPSERSLARMKDAVRDGVNEGFRPKTLQKADHNPGRAAE